MKLDRLKLLFDEGALRSAAIRPYMGKWVIEIEKKSGERVPLETQRGEIRQTKTLDAAWKAVEQIGFAQASIKRGPEE